MHYSRLRKSENPKTSERVSKNILSNNSSVVEIVIEGDDYLMVLNANCDVFVILRCKLEVRNLQPPK